MQTLRLSEDFMGRLSFPEFLLLQSRYYEEKDYWPAQLVAAQYNTHRGPDADPVEPVRLMRIPQKPVELSPDLGVSKEDLEGAFGFEITPGMGGIF